LSGTASIVGFLSWLCDDRYFSFYRSSFGQPSVTTDAFAIVLKDGSTLSAEAVFASDDGLHYVDPDERHLRISMREVDRAATLKLNRARNLNLHLPATQ
jgi:hypothetical protein